MKQKIERFNLGNGSFLLVKDQDAINWYYWDEEESLEGTSILFQEGEAVLSKEAGTLILFAGEEYEEEEGSEMREIEAALKKAPKWRGSRYFIEVDDLGIQTLCASHTGLPVEDETILTKILPFIKEEMDRYNS